MSRDDHGGPAFPLATSHFVQQRGMSLRDWFAGQALAGLLGSRVAPAPWDQWALEAYRLADAMLAARSTPTATTGA